MRKVLLAATALALLFGASASAQPAAPPDPNGYYNQNDHNGYYDQNGVYHRYSDQNANGQDAGPPPDDAGPPPDDAGPPPPPPPGYDDRSYREGYYEDNCRRGNIAAGTIFGAIAGGLIGGAASHGGGGAVVGGAILGGLLGNAVAHDMPCEDHPYAFRAYARGLDGDLGQRYEWHNGPDYGYFVPERQFDRDGRVCRTWTETTYTRDRTFTRSGTACRYRDGNWHFDD